LHGFLNLCRPFRKVKIGFAQIGYVVESGISLVAAIAGWLLRALAEKDLAKSTTIPEEVAGDPVENRGPAATY
jgi:hypothetical protein